jgi:outer membrane receptor protein involved in Fe transport
MTSIRSANSIGAKLTALLGSASLLTIAYTGAAYAQGEQIAQAEEIPETVLITGSLIRGTAAVGVPVTNLAPMDFAVTGALTTADLFRTFPAANVSPGAPATAAGNFVGRNTRVNLRGLDTGDAVRSLLMVDGMRYPAQGQGLCMIDPSIIPALALDHIDILVDGASATYGSDAIGGVINIILKRNMDGATTQLRWTTAEGGKNRYLASAIWGRTWDGGQITISYEWYNETPVRGDAHSNMTPTSGPGVSTTGGISAPRPRRSFRRGRRASRAAETSARRLRWVTAAPTATPFPLVLVRIGPPVTPALVLPRRSAARPWIGRPSAILPTRARTASETSSTPTCSRITSRTRIVTRRS